MDRGRRAGWRRVRIAGVCLGAVLVGCAPRANEQTLPQPAARRQPLALPRTRPSEFDPIGLLLELKPELWLTDEQVRDLRALRAELRRSNGPVLAQLDSADAALKGRLRGWLGTAQGANLPVRRTRWVPKVAPPERDLLVGLLACVRQRTEGARAEAIGLLSSEQRSTLERIVRRDARLAALAASGTADVEPCTAVRNPKPAPPPETPSRAVVDTCGRCGGLAP